jgi:hypothetical protein
MHLGESVLLGKTRRRGGAGFETFQLGLGALAFGLQYGKIAHIQAWDRVFGGVCNGSQFG